MAKLNSQMLINPQVIRSASATGDAAVGTYAEDETGAGFRYVQNGATLMAVGNLYQAAPETTTHENLTPTAAAVGDTSVTVTLGATAAIENEYAGGQLIVTKNLGEGNRYNIESHPSAAASGSLTLKLSEPVAVAFDASSTIDLARNPYRFVIVSPTAESSSTVGVALHALGASEFGWLQTKGPAAVRAAEAIGVGLSVVHSTATAGAVGAAAEEGLQNIGYALTGIAASEFGAVYLNID